MKISSDNNQPDFWTVRYAAGKTPWDFGGVPAALKSFLERSSVPGRVLIPGCGSGYEVQAFYTAGHDVAAIDFSPAAVDQAKRVLGALAGRIILGDFFTHDFGQRRFDFIYERTFLPGGRLIGVFLYGSKLSSGPPFPLTEPEANQLFKKPFERVRSEVMTDSLPFIRDMERWQEWLKVD